jgi:hypothetical protein
MDVLYAGRCAESWLAQSRGSFDERSEVEMHPMLGLSLFL